MCRNIVTTFKNHVSTITIGVLICLWPYAASAYTIADVNKYINDSRQQYQNCRIYSETYTQDSWMGYRIFKDCKDSVVYSEKRYDIAEDNASQCLSYCGWLEISRCTGPDSLAVTGYVNANEIWYSTRRREVQYTYCSGRTEKAFDAATTSPIMNRQRCFMGERTYPGACMNTVELLKNFYPVCSTDDPCCGIEDPCCGVPNCCPVGPGGDDTSREGK